MKREKLIELLEKCPKGKNVLFACIEIAPKEIEKEISKGVIAGMGFVRLASIRTALHDIQQDVIYLF